MPDDGRRSLYLDTHVVVWLRQGELKRLPPSLRERLDRAPDLRISPMVLVELEVLREIGRLNEDSTTLIGSLARDVGLKVCDLSFAAAAAAARLLTWTRDPFDRLIVGHAAAAQAPLVTRDRRIRRHFAAAFWGG